MMKVLIVDDEQHVINAIRYLVNWDEYPECQIYEAHNGEEALEKIQIENMDIVFTDMQMPKMDGLTLLKWMTEQKNRPQIIAVSNHSNFEYMRQVVKSGGIDYILKPIDPIQINEAFSKAIAEVNKVTTITDNTIKVNAYTPIYFAKLMSDIIKCDSYSKYQVKQINEHYGIDERELTIAIVQLPHALSLAKSLFDDDISLMFFSINNVCNEIIGEKQGIAFRYQPEEDRSLVLFWGDDKDLFNKLALIKETIYKLFDRNPNISMSHSFQGIETLSNAYSIASKALATRNILDETVIVWKQRELSYKIDYQGKVKEYFKEIALFIQAGDEEKVVLIEDEFNKHVSTYPYLTVEDIDAFYRGFTNWMKKSFNLNEAYEQQVPHSLKDMRMFIAKIINDLIQQHKKLNQGTDLIENTLEYIDEHYNENISLAQIAEIFYVSKEHLSRSFKKKIGKTISEYVTERKMKRAKYLLAETKHSIKEIAMLVGYKDEKYFSKVYKKFYKRSPKDCRE